MSVETIGFLAALIGTCALVPQVVKTVKTRRTKDLSIHMYTMQLFAVFLWLLYGVLIHDRPLIVANMVTFICIFTIFVLIVKERMNK